MSKYKEISYKRYEPENNVASSSTKDNKSSSTEKFTINQNVSSSKQWPKHIKRSVDSNEIVIPRRHGEGNKPLFAREDVKINNYKILPKAYLDRKSVTSSSSSSPERYRRTEKKQSNQKKNELAISISSEKQREKNVSDKIPYFADEKREQERLQRKKTITLSKKQQQIRIEKPNFSHRQSPRTSKKSRSKSREYSSHRSYNRDERHRRSRSRSYRRSRSRTRSRSREKHRRETAPYMPPIYPVMIAAPSSSDYVYGSSNWLQQFVPVPPAAPPRYPYFMRPTIAPFPPIAAIPPVRYPIPPPNSTFYYHQNIRLHRTPRFKYSNRGFHRPRNP